MIISPHVITQIPTSTQTTIMADAAKYPRGGQPHTGNPCHSNADLRTVLCGQILVQTARSYNDKGTFILNPNINQPRARQIYLEALRRMSDGRRKNRFDRGQLYFENWIALWRLSRGVRRGWNLVSRIPRYRCQPLRRGSYSTTTVPPSLLITYPHQPMTLRDTETARLPAIHAASIFRGTHWHHSDPSSDVPISLSSFAQGLLSSLSCVMKRRRQEADPRF